MTIRIGTSGWSYPHWGGHFYPAEQSRSRWLQYYARHFDTVEVNRSFYRLPEKRVFDGWRKQTPPAFTFSVKASRYTTHMKKLRDPQDTLPLLLDAVTGLRDKQGPMLFQLPPHWRVNEARLEAFLSALPPKLPVAFELRDRSWHTDAVLARLADHNAAFCIYDLAGFQSPREMTADFAYVRLHGPSTPYSDRYGRKRLTTWADWIRRLPVDDVFVYFDNDEAAYAVIDALELRALLGLPRMSES